MSDEATEAPKSNPKPVPKPGQENAISMAKEHPEDVAMLIRTWLMEE